MTVKIGFLILFLSISLTTQAGDRLKGISGSMGKSANPFSKLFSADSDDDNVATKLEAEPDATQIKEVERHNAIKAAPAILAPDQEKKAANTFVEIDLISDINDQFENIINKLETAEAQPTINPKHKKPTKLIINDSDPIQATNENDTVQTTNTRNILQTANQIATIQPPDKDCVTEKVYSLNVDNAAQYKHLEDFPFTYECVIQR